jgi:hypothetical protein
MGEIADLVGAERAAAAGMFRPSEDAGLEERAVDDELAAPLEQVEQARLALRAFEHIVFLDEQPRHAAALGGQRVLGAGERLFLDKHLLEGAFPRFLGNDRRCLHMLGHCSCPVLGFGWG